MGQHWYNRAGDLVDPWTPGAYPSVSTILDRVRSDAYEALVGRMGQEGADALMEVAAARGIRVHKACELYAKGADITTAAKESELLIEEMPYLQGFVAWAERYVKRFIAVERYVESEKHKYGGRLDIIAEMLDGTIWIVDNKTGQDSIRHGLQLKLYWQAVIETLGLRCRQGVLALDAKRKVGYRNTRAQYGLKEYKEPWAPAEAHIKVFKWWNKKNPPRAPKEVEVWEPNLTEVAI